MAIALTYKSWMKLAGQIKRLSKRGETKKQGRPQLRWEDCLKRDLGKAEEEDKWGEKASNRERWKKLTIAAVPQSHPPQQGNKRKNTSFIKL